jgi:hypothetical protein
LARFHYTLPYAVKRQLLTLTSNPMSYIDDDAILEGNDTSEEGDE